MHTIERPLGPDIVGILHRAFPGHAVRSFAAMTGGLINAMYRVELEGLEDPDRKSVV